MPTDVLLDTHSLLWVLDGGQAFGLRARRTLEESSEVSFSAISIAEIRIKELLGELSVPDDLLHRIGQAGLRPAAYSVDAAEGLAAWPMLVRHDPFDRLLLTQAAAARTALLTADHVLLSVPDAPVIDARA